MTPYEAVRRAGSVKALAALFTPFEGRALTHQAIYAWRDRIPPLRLYQLRALKPGWFRRRK